MNPASKPSPSATGTPAAPPARPGLFGAESWSVPLRPGRTPFWLRWARLLHKPPAGGPAVWIGDPRSLAGQRFDIYIKYLYAKALEDGEGLELFREIYREHLRVWNGFREHNPPKRSFKDFDRSFKETLGSIRKFGFSPSISLVPVRADEWYPVNGAHRIAAAMLYRQPVCCRVGAYPCEHYDETFFRRQGLDEDYIALVKCRIPESEPGW